MTVSPAEASDAGQLIEHTETLFEGTFATRHNGEDLPNAIRSFRAAEAAPLFARFVRNGTSVTPTLNAWRYLIEHPDTSFLADPHLRYVARSIRERARTAAPPLPGAELPELQRTYAEYREVVRQMSAAGVTILAGTDIAGARIPGFSLHEELAALVDAGLSPLQALQAATLNPARIMNRERDFGGVTVGGLADLVLLDANPLDDIRNAERIDAVVVAGRLLGKSALASLLRSAADSAERH
jgi:hypothetical protein